MVGDHNVACGLFQPRSVVGDTLLARVHQAGDVGKCVALLTPERAFHLGREEREAVKISDSFEA